MICNQSNRAIDPYSAGNRITDGGLIACPDCGKPVRLLPPLKGMNWGRLARHHEPKEETA